jgi:hypothetical protein
VSPGQCCLFDVSSSVRRLAILGVQLPVGLRRRTAPTCAFTHLPLIARWLHAAELLLILYAIMFLRSGGRIPYPKGD